MTPNDTKKGSFLDRFSGKGAASSTNTNDSMFLNTDLIHEGISDDDLDLLLSGDIKSSANPPKNPMPAEFTEEELAMDDLDDLLALAESGDALDINSLSADETLDLDEDELLGLDALDAVLAADTSEPEVTEAMSTKAMSTGAVPEAIPTMVSNATPQTTAPQTVQSPALNNPQQSSNLQNDTPSHIQGHTQGDDTPKEVSDLVPSLADTEVVDLITPLSEQNLDKQSSQPAAAKEQAATHATETADALELEAVPLTASPVAAQSTTDDALTLEPVQFTRTTTDTSQSDTLEIQTAELADPAAATVEIKAVTPEALLASEKVEVSEVVNVTDTKETAAPETESKPQEAAPEPKETVLEGAIPALDVTVETPAVSTEQIQAKQAEEAHTATPAESMKAQLTSALPSVSASVLATGAVTATSGSSLAATPSHASSSPASAAQPSEKPENVLAKTKPEAPASVSDISKDKETAKEATKETTPVQNPAQSSTQGSVQATTKAASSSTTSSTAASTTNQTTSKDDLAELKTVLHPIPESVKSRLHSSDDSVKAEKPASAAPAVSVTAVKPHTPKPATGSASKVTFNKPSGKNTMTNENQAALLEKVQVDIDELKRKLHSMNSDFYNAATDSAVLISQVRELETKSAGDFNGTYTQSRELRRLLVDARKIFNQLASGIDMLEESLETDLYAVEKKA